MKPRIICIHIGARAHYLLPKALKSKNNLEALITDTWISSNKLRSFLARFPLRLVKSFANRFTSSIPSQMVYSFSLRFLLIEIYLRFKYNSDWTRILKRNYYFQHIAIKKFKKLSTKSAVLGISYTSLNIFEVAKHRNQKTILFQIDPGYKEEQIVADIVNTHGDIFTTNWKPAPDSYWVEWKTECSLSDIIMVNSEWSKLGLIEQGISADKIQVLPIPFQMEPKQFRFNRIYPEVFTTSRPLRCLFLGTLTLRKGIHLVLAAAAKLINYPIEFVLVGENELAPSLLKAPNVNYRGVASRSETDLYYQGADVFLFPTLSDGFGLTQLEAMSWQLPVIASVCCGEVVINEHNGLQLSNCSVENLIKALLKLLHNPGYLKQLSSHCLETVEQFSLENFADGLSQLI